MDGNIRNGKEGQKIWKYLEDVQKMRRNIFKLMRGCNAF